MKHAGIHWPENAGGEHPSREAIVAMPGMQGATLICSPSARYHYQYVRQQCPSAVVVWRAIPRQGKLPAQLNWIGSSVADECLNLWNEQPHSGIEWFTPLNELQFVKENGAPFPGYGPMAQNLAGLRVALRDRFRSFGQDVRLVWPAWVPSDDGDFLDDWRHEANNWDVIGLHCYGSAETMRARYQSYRDAFPSHPIFVGEWNSNHEGHDERASLEMWAEVSNTDPGLLGVAYYIWETNNAGERDLSIWGNGSRMALFLNPPQAEPVPEPIPEPEPVPMPVDPWQHFTAEELAAVTECPLENVQANWPRLVGQLHHCGINEQLVQIGLAGTIAIESASTMAPVREAYYLGEPEPAETHRKTLSYYPYYGRGFIQLTHRGNYLAYGPKVAALWGTDPAQPDFDLVGQPDRALDPDISAAVSALFFRDTATIQGYSLVDACRKSDWDWVRRLVLGGVDPAGTARIARIAAELTGAQPIPTPGKVTYNASTPAIAQDDDWSCAPTALRWALTSLGRNPGPKYIEELLVRDGVVSKEQGLLDASGAGLAAWIGKPGSAYYGDDGFYGNNEPAVSFDGVALEGDHTYPLLIGGRAWNHWSGVRGYDAGRGLLLLANPAEGWGGIGQTMDAAQFRSLGPFSMVRVLHPDLLTTVPEPPVEPPAEDTRIPRARQKLVEAIAILDEPAP